VGPRRRLDAVLKDVNRSEITEDIFKLWAFALLSFDECQFI
jgi:hypothetical protein